ncbi:FAD-binding oxidoreductase [Halostella sp. JP-L12]|uniref:NAD(P)/FAD-dependent oxidoreductase n=1 Tax=Halostella TaxID=1843185 RepID=UPI000EF7EE8D|nr:MULTISPECIES: FAD-dependent oxidoreductase [Halostella]NHN48045.1 FAD-binding oxidoreductase [Halostella sp. JP-L12]
MADDVLVVGGGVIGCAVARALAPDHDVRLVERDHVASGATALAAGEVTMTPSYTDHPNIAAHANAFFREYDGAEFTERPSLELVPSKRESQARRRADRLTAEDLPVEFLDSGSVETCHPRFDLDGFAGAVRHADTGFLDPYAFATALQANAVDRGATVETGTVVEDVLVTDGSVRGVATDDGERRASTVVVAAGWRSEQLLRDVLQVPVRPYRTQCVVLDPAVDLSDDFPMGWIPGEHVYFRPEHSGRLLVGGWSFAEDDPDRASGDEDEAFRDHVADLLPRVLNGFERARFVDGWAGVDSATPDTRPIVDAPPVAPEGLVVATGFHGRGVMTAPVAATAVRSLVTGEKAPFSLRVFSLDRFDSTRRDFEFRSISAGTDA